MENENQLSDYEAGNGLKPVGELSREEARAEIAKMNQGGDSHPYFNEFNLQHRNAVERMQGLISRLSLSDEEKAKQAQVAKEKLQQESDALWDKYEKDRLEETIRRGQDKIREKLAAEGKTVSLDDAGQIITNAQDVFSELEKAGIVDEGFREFLEDDAEEGQEAEGDRLENLEAFDVLNSLLARYRAWAEKKGRK
jgi:hypothetical protein